MKVNLKVNNRVGGQSNRNSYQFKAPIFFCKLQFLFCSIKLLTELICASEIHVLGLSCTVTSFLTRQRKSSSLISLHFLIAEYFSRNLHLTLVPWQTIEIILLTIFSCASLSPFTKEYLFISIFTRNRLFPTLVVSKPPSFLHRMSASVIFVSSIILSRRKVLKKDLL